MKPGERYVTGCIHAVAKLRQRDRQAPQGERGEPLYSLLNQVRTCGATKRRDRIYALYNFLPKEIQDATNKKSYNEHTVEALFTKVAEADFLRRSDLPLLSAAGVSQQVLELPSWVPDWTFAAKHHTLTLLDQDCWDQGRGVMFQASGPGSMSAPWLSDFGKTLHGQVRRLGIITKVAQPFEFPLPGTNKSDSQDDRWRILYRLMAQRQSQIKSCISFAREQQPYATGPDIVGACQRVLTAGMKPAGGGDTLGLLVLASDAEIAADFEALNNTFEQMHSMERYTPQRGPQGILYSIQDACKARVFFVMQRNQSLEVECEEQGTRYMGLAPEMAKDGDLIYVVLGCSVPFLFRPIGQDAAAGQQTTEPRFQLIGECYAYGFMQGEVMTMSDVETQELAIT